jgi:pimeloyl-ACP methyl ester carboxylesterase
LIGRREAVDKRLPAEEWWPAGERDVASRQVTLKTGLRLRVIDAGPEHGTPVVLVHGWGIHSYLWRRTIPELVAAGHRVHAIDLPGHGLSERPVGVGSYTIEAVTSHLAAVLDALQLDRTAIIAQSMGGRVALELARIQAHRVSGLVLFASVGFGEVPAMVSLVPHLPEVRGPLSTMLVQRWMVALGKAFAYGRRARVQQSDIDAYWAATQFPDFVPAMRQALVDFDWRPLTREVLAAIATPTLVIFGTRDRTVRPVNAALRVSALPHGRLHWVRDAGHVANEEAPDEVNPVVVEFVSGLK